MDNNIKRCRISTSIWNDRWFFHMVPEEKFFYLYLLTNSHTNFLGIYRLTIERMIRETRLGKAIIEKTLIMFTAARKVFYVGGFIIIPKWRIPR